MFHWSQLGWTFLTNVSFAHLNAMNMAQSWQTAVSQPLLTTTCDLTDFTPLSTKVPSFKKAHQPVKYQEHLRNVQNLSLVPLKYLSVSISFLSLTSLGIYHHLGLSVPDQEGVDTYRTVPSKYGPNHWYLNKTSIKKPWKLETGGRLLGTLGSAEQSGRECPGFSHCLTHPGLAADEAAGTPVDTGKTVPTRGSFL